MSKKFNAKERERLAQELIASDLDFNLDILGPSKNLRKSFKTSIEKLKNYNLIVGDLLTGAIIDSFQNDCFRT